MDEKSLVNDDTERLPELPPPVVDVELDDFFDDPPQATRTAPTMTATDRTVTRLNERLMFSSLSGTCTFLLPVVPANSPTLATAFPTE
jgi:hypothetical protein